MIYDAKQEQRRLELIAELNALDVARSAVLQRLEDVLTQALGIGMPGGNSRAIQVAKFADELRDALKPFDSGVRLAQPAPRVPHY